MTLGPEADRVLLAPIHECLRRIQEYTAGDRARFESSRLVQDATVRNLQTPAESSQRLSNDIKGTEPGIPWRELSGFRNVIVHGSIASPVRRAKWVLSWSLLSQGRRYPANRDAENVMDRWLSTLFWLSA